MVYLHRNNSTEAVERVKELQKPEIRAQLDALGMPSFVRLEIPIKNPFSLRKISDELRHLALNLDQLARSSEPEEWRTMVHATVEIRAANMRISERLKIRRNTTSGG